MKPLAIFTTIQHEPEFYPKWINYYTTQIDDPSNLYILNHTTPHWTPPPNPNTIPIHNPRTEPIWLTLTNTHFYNFLLQSYTWVLITDIDEFIIPLNPSTGHPQPLIEWIEKNSSLAHNGAIRTTGYEVVHNINTEPPLNLTAPWLPQRSQMYSTTTYSKTLLANRPMQWSPGCHQPTGPATNTTQPPNPHLTLLHLNKIDYHLSQTRSHRATKANWPTDPAHNPHNGIGWVARATDPNVKAKLLTLNIDDLTPITNWITIPTVYKSLGI